MRFSFFLMALCFLHSSPVLSDGDNTIFELEDFAFESGATLPNARLSYVTYGALERKQDQRRSPALLVFRQSPRLRVSQWAGKSSRLFRILHRGHGHVCQWAHVVAQQHAAAFRGTRLSRDRDPGQRERHAPASHRRARRRTSAGGDRLLDGRAASVSMGGEPPRHGGGGGRDLRQREGVSLWHRASRRRQERPHGDSAWNEGRYDKPPEVGLKALARHWATWGVSQEWWRRETYRELGYASIEERLLAVEEGWLRRDANNLLWQAKMWQRHNVGDTPGFGSDFEKALRSIKARVLLMPSETDLYFPVADAEYESRFIPDAKLVPIPSIWGHGAGAGRGPGDAEFLNRAIADFLGRSR